MIQEHDVQAYKRRMTWEYIKKYYGALPSENFLAGFDAGRNLGEVQGMVKALEIVLSANPDSPFLQTTVTEMRKALRELLKSGEK